MDISFNKKLRFKPESVIRIQSVLLLYIERIFVGFFCRHSGLCQEKSDKKRPIENKKTAENMNEHTYKIICSLMTDGG